MGRHRYWALLKTKQANSADARRHVRRQGFEIYHPEYRSRQNLRNVRRLPLFPFYLLVRVDVRERWQSLNSTTGVSHVFTSNELPSRVQDADIRRFRDIENRNGLVQLDQLLAPRFDPDQPVVATGGWVEGCEGIYQGLVGDSAARVRVLFSILGKPTVLEVSAFDLARRDIRRAA
jgi:transcription antitermination factor NusG